MENIGGFLCLGSILLAPLVTFVVGLLIGGNKLPFKVRIERNNTQKQYEVDDGTPVEWQ